MTGYVIRRTDQGGGFVSRPGSEKSYTRNLENARIFKTRGEAEADRCPGNEVVVDLADLLSHS